MSSTDIAELRDTTVDSASPGQTFFNFFGEGGRADSTDDAGRELCQDRESFEHWFMVSRPPANNTFGAGEITEVVIHRLGGNDVIASATKNREIEAQVRTELARDLEEGECVFFTGDGTAFSYMDIKADGTTVQVSNDGGGNTVTITMDPATGNFDLKTSGKVRIGGASADTPLTRYAELLTLWGNLKTAFDTHTHIVPLVQPGLANITSAVTVITAPAWDPSIASASGETD